MCSVAKTLGAELREVSQLTEVVDYAGNLDLTSHGRSV